MKRLGELPAAGTKGDASEQIATTLTEVEDEMSDLPSNPEAWIDGRMYPPKADAERDVQGYPDVKRYRNKGHNTFVRANGAIRIATIPDGCVVLDKAGSNGKRVFDP